MKKWIIKNRERIFKSKIFSLINNQCYHPEKKITYDFYTVDTYDWINIVALTEKNDIIIVKQHRLGTDEFTYETPGGIIEGDESPEDCALRELQEETGYRAEKIFFLKKFDANPAIQNNKIYFYAATGCKKVSDQMLDQEEDIEVSTFSHDKILSMINNNEFSHSIAVTALCLYFLSEHNKYNTIKNLIQ